MKKKQPFELAKQIKARLANEIGPYITCSIGFAANRLLAKIASEVEKPNGIVIWQPDDLPEKLFALNLDDIPGIGNRMLERLIINGITTTKELMHLSIDAMRRIWGSIEGERFWYSLHGYALEPIPTKRAMFGHSRVLTPENRHPENARNCARLLTVKAARRLRRSGYMAGGFALSIRFTNKTRWSADMSFPSVADDHTFLLALTKLWKEGMREIGRNQIKKPIKIKHISVSLFHLKKPDTHQADLFSEQTLSYQQQKWQLLAETMDIIVSRYGSKAASLGIWEEPPGGYAGAKIAFGRIPNLSDF